MKIKTKLTKLGRNPFNNKGFVNPPIFKGSTILFKDFKSYIQDRDKKDDDDTANYGIQFNPTSKNLENSISNLYNSFDTVLTPSGLSALVVPFLAFLRKGDHVLINDDLYNPTRKFCENILKKFDIQIDYFHPIKSVNKFEKLIKKNTKLIFIESPGTATFDIIDIPKISKIAKKYNIYIAVDNTWGSPLFCNPIKLGANVIIEAATKYINGHSDILLGIISSDKKTSKIIRYYTKIMGLCPGSEETYLALRGLPTLETRLKEIEKNALNLANRLNKHPKIKNVYHPALKNNKNNKIWKRDFSGSTGLFSFELKKNYSNNTLNKFYNRLKIFKLGYSWGGFESLITFPTINSRKFNYNVKGTLIRVYCGHEDNDDQINDLISSIELLK